MPGFLISRCAIFFFFAMYLFRQKYIEPEVGTIKKSYQLPKPWHEALLLTQFQLNENTITHAGLYRFCVISVSS